MVSNADEFPQHETTIINDDQELRCYNLEAAKIFLGWHLDKHELEEKKGLLEKENSFLRVQVDALYKINTKKDEVIALLSHRNDNLFDAWKEENKKRHDAENDVDFLPWTMAAVTSIIALGSLSYSIFK